MSSKKRRRSLPALLNPFSLFGMGNNANNTNDDEKKSETHDNNSWSPLKLKNNTQIQYLSGHNDIVRCLCKMDENRFASSGDDNLILIWSLNNGLLLDVLCGHTKSILCLLVIEYKSYKLLISASLDNTIKIWNISLNITNIKCISTLNNYNSPIIKIIYYSNNHSNGLITASNNGKIGVWIIKKEKEKEKEKEKKKEIEIEFELLRIINIKEPINITEMLFLNTNTTKQLIIGCKNGKIIFINFDKNYRIKFINKHLTEIKYIYQSSIDRFITASYDGLICVWRIEPHGSQLLERINDVQQNISSWSNTNINTNTNNTQINANIITEPKDLKLNCFIHFNDNFNNKYFIVSFSNSFVIFDSKFLVKAIIKNIYNCNTEIIAMTIFGKKNNLILVTANNKNNIIKLWNLTKINLKSIKNGVWLSCFRQELLYNLDNKKNKNKNKNKNIVNDLCIDSDNLLINTFTFHSDKIMSIKTVNQYTFVTCDKMKQIILWKNAYYVSNVQNNMIKKHYNL